jgi:hypothetical protein
MTTANEALALAPDSVDARVVLVASLVETGRLDAARQAAREMLSIDPRLTLQRFAASRPYRDAAALEQLVDSLRRAGLPEGREPASPQRIELAQPQAASRRRVASRPRH